MTDSLSYGEAADRPPLVPAEDQGSDQPAEDLPPPPGWTVAARPLAYVVHLLALVVLVRLGTAAYGAWHQFAASPQQGIGANDKLLLAVAQSTEVDLLLVLGIGLLAAIAVLPGLAARRGDAAARVGAEASGAEASGAEASGAEASGAEASGEEEDRWAGVDALRAGSHAGISLALASAVVLVVFIIAMEASQSPNRAIVNNSDIATLGFLVQPAVIALVVFGLALAVARYLRGWADREEAAAQEELAAATRAESTPAAQPGGPAGEPAPNDRGLGTDPATGR